jgi:hypothetical protein
MRIDAEVHERAEAFQIPDKIDLLPHNGHPNRAGLELYAAMVARVLRDRDLL